MKKTVIKTLVYSLLAAFTVMIGVMLCFLILSLSDVGDVGNWNIILMMPKSVALIVAIILIALDIACILMCVLLTISDIKLRKAAKIDAEKKKKQRFPRLTAIDRLAENRPKKQYDDNVTLEELCEGFRNFAASRMGLYYDKDIIRSYIAGMAVTRLTVMQGISGTGKTSLAYAFGRFLSGESVMVPVQPSWKDRTDLIGYYNEFTDSYTETDLLCKLYEANLDNEIYTVVLDEMNIARVEYYFAEFLSLLELPDNDSRRIRVTNDSRENDPKLFAGGTLKLPSNVWFTGTANNDDSTLALSDKVYDRAFIIDMSRRAKPFKAPDQPPVRISANKLVKLFESAKTAGGLSAGIRENIEKLDGFLRENFGVTFGNRIFRQLEGFVPVFTACGGSEIRAIDIMISRKILRKLESLDPLLVASNADPLARLIDELFSGELDMCAEILERYTGKSIR